MEKNLDDMTLPELLATATRVIALVRLRLSEERLRGRTLRDDFTADAVRQGEAATYVTRQAKTLIFDGSDVVPWVIVEDGDYSEALTFTEMMGRLEDADFPVTRVVPR